MNVSDIVFTPQTYNGTTAFMFTINDRYNGYTWDHALFHVYDTQSGNFADYTTDINLWPDLPDFQTALNDGTFTGSGSNSLVIDNGGILPVQTPGQSPVATLFIVGVVVMIGYLVFNKG